MNIPINSRIVYLWQQFSARTATRAELDELLQLLSSGEHDEVSRQYLQQLLESTAAAEVDTDRWIPVLQQILHPVGQTHLAPEETATIVRPLRAPVRKIVRAIMGAAAVVLMVLGLTHLWRTSSPRNATTGMFAAEIPPGGNKAVLTLSSGQKIVLDTAAAGLLATEGNTKVEKRTDGQLAYETGNKKTETNLLNTLTTPKGGQFQLTLPDGTKAWLNAASAITYPAAFTGSQRIVDIKGEVYFEVAKDKRHPFKVRTAGQIIEDIGTQFNVNAYSDEPVLVTTLLEGAVRLGGHILKPGEKATIRPSGTIDITKGNVKQAIAWKNGIFYFSDADLKTVMRQLSRWYNVDIKYEGDIPERQFNGMIGRSLTLGEVLKGLALQRVHYHMAAGNQLIITP